MGPYATFPPQPMPIAPVTLEGRVVRLEPLGLEHVEGLVAAALADLSIWHWMPVRPTGPADVREMVAAALAARLAGTELPFATVERASGAVVGSTRFLAIEPGHHRVEIGWTWLTPRAQGTAANPEAKLLMLRHAFEAWGCNRVEFKTDAQNERSRAAILALGATFEGTFRAHMVVPPGRVRDSAYYAITWDGWPAVAARLEARVAARAAAADTAPGGAPGTARL